MHLKETDLDIDTLEFIDYCIAWSMESIYVLILNVYGLDWIVECGF